MYLIRLDDASIFMDINKWDRMESLLDKEGIKPLVGIIPNNQDLNIINKYKRDEHFWEKAKSWQYKNWIIALHGYTHVYNSNCGGINPVNNRSEFAGTPLEVQKEKIEKGIMILKNQGLLPTVFFAPSHTFDVNTLEALKLKSDIRIISDTIANDVYQTNGFYFIPQQSSNVRKLPFRVTTFCYHPNEMSDDDFNCLESFINKYKTSFYSFSDVAMKDRKLSLYDRLLRIIYFKGRLIRRKAREFYNGKSD